MSCIIHICCTEGDIVTTKAGLCLCVCLSVFFWGLVCGFSPIPRDYRENLAYTGGGGKKAVESLISNQNMEVWKMWEIS